MEKNKEVDIFVDTPKKKISLSDLKPATIKNRTSKKNNLRPEAVIVLPEKIDSKLLEKVNFYRELVSDRAPKIMRVVANIGGYTFIVGGIYLCFLITDIKEGKVNSLLALTSCGTDNCISIINPDSSTSTTVQNISNLQFPEPQVLFSSDFPREPETDFLIRIESKNVSEIKFFLTSDNLSGPIELTAKETNIYSVPVSTLKPGIYTFRAKALALDKITILISFD